MKRSLGFLGIGAIGCVALGGSIAAGYIEQKTQREEAATRTFGQGVSRAQAMERQRGRAAAIAVAETAAK